MIIKATIISIVTCLLTIAIFSIGYKTGVKAEHDRLIAPLLQEAKPLR